MAAHMLDHFVFTARLLSERTKNILFGIVAFAIVANFWWFRGVAWGIDGAINEYWGLGWRQVSFGLMHCRAGVVPFADIFVSPGTFTSSIECDGATAATPHKPNIYALCGLIRFSPRITVDDMSI
jgi:hypothetical protein